MKYFILLSLFILIACDVPSQRRQIFQSSGNQYAPPVGDGLVNTPGAQTPNGGTTSTPTSGAGFEACSLSPKGNSVSLGAVGICKSSIDPTQIKFRTSLSDTQTRTCIIPTYKDQSGNSTYLGDPQCTLTVAGNIYSGKLFITRQGFQNYPMTGVIIMKEPLLDGYYQCMHSFVTGSMNCANSPAYQTCFQQQRFTNPAAHQYCCQLQAKAYQAQVCNTFKSNFAGQYLDLSL